MLALWPSGQPSIRRNRPAILAAESGQQRCICPGSTDQLSWQDSNLAAESGSRSHSAQTAPHPAGPAPPGPTAAAAALFDTAPHHPRCASQRSPRSAQAAAAKRVVTWGVPPPLHAARRAAPAKGAKGAGTATRPRAPPPRPVVSGRGFGRPAGSGDEAADDGVARFIEVLPLLPAAPRPAPPRPPRPHSSQAGYDL